MIKYKVTLTESERKELNEIVSKGKHRAQKILNALILLNTDVGQFQDKRSKNEDLTHILKISMRKIDRVKKAFVEQGLDIALNGTKGQRLYKKKADGDFEAYLLALSCSDPPKGYARWSLRMLADKVVELEYADSMSYETIRRVLKKTKLNPGANKGG